MGWFKELSKPVARCLGDFLPRERKEDGPRVSGADDNNDYSQGQGLLRSIQHTKSGKITQQACLR